MKNGFDDSVVEDDCTVEELMARLHLSPSAPMLLEVNGEILYPDEVGGRRVKKGDKLTLVPVLAGG